MCATAAARGPQRLEAEPRRARFDLVDLALFALADQREEPEPLLVDESVGLPAGARVAAGRVPVGKGVGACHGGGAHVDLVRVDDAPLPVLIDPTEHRAAADHRLARERLSEREDPVRLHGLVGEGGERARLGLLGRARGAVFVREQEAAAPLVPCVSVEGVDTILGHQHRQPARHLCVLIEEVVVECAPWVQVE